MEDEDDRQVGTSYDLVTIEQQLLPEDKIADCEDVLPPAHRYPPVLSRPHQSQSPAPVPAPALSPILSDTTPTLSPSSSSLHHSQSNRDPDLLQP